MASNESSTDELEQIIGIIWGFVPSRVLQIAVTTGVFEIIHRRGKQSPDDLAHVLGWTVQVVDCFLDLLARMGLLDKAIGSYGLTKSCEKWFLKSSEQYLGDFVVRSSLLDNAYNDFVRFSARGRPVPAMLNETVAAFGEDKEATKAFVQCMHAMSTEFASQLENLVDLSKCRRLLDIGAGKGTLSVTFALSNPQLECDLFDLPGVALHARKYISSLDLNKRCRVYECSWNDWNWTYEYDCVIMSQVLHEMKVEEAMEIVARSSRCISRDGHILVVNTLPTDVVDSVLGPVFSLNMVVELGTWSPTLEWVRQQFSLNGIVEHSVFRLPGARVCWVGKVS